MKQQRMNANFSSSFLHLDLNDDGVEDDIQSKSVPASTRLEDPSKKGTKRTAKSAPINPCPSREGPYSTVFSVSRPMDPLMWLGGLLALSGDVETNPGPTTQTWTCDMCSTEITGRQTSYKCNSSPSHWVFCVL